MLVPLMLKNDVFFFSSFFLTLFDHRLNNLHTTYIGACMGVQPLHQTRLKENKNWRFDGKWQQPLQISMTEMLEHQRSPSLHLGIN
jgi:hypothetical protein